MKTAVTGYPKPGDYIDIHTHESVSSGGIVAVENLMAHEDRLPSDLGGRLCTYGIHPWHLTTGTASQMLEKVRLLSSSPSVIAIGEAGFDRLKGADPLLQLSVFTQQVDISEKAGKPMFIHCVKAWDELLGVHRKLKPRMPWMIHGFRGKPELARQFLSRGMYLSFWFAFVMRPESAQLLRIIPPSRMFLETDGAPLSITEIYCKVAADLGISEDELKDRIYSNFNALFNIVR